MSQIVIRIVLEVPDGTSVQVAPEGEPDFASEPVPVEVPHTNGAPQPIRPAAQSRQTWAEGQVHAQGHKPLRTNKRGLFCPTKMPDGEWCDWSAK